MKRSFDTMVEAIQDLKSRGYTEDFNLEKKYIKCLSDGLEIFARDFKVDEFYRFEGETNPADESIVYAISSNSHDRMGTLVDAYGPYADQLSAEMVERLKFRPDAHGG